MTTPASARHAMEPVELSEEIVHAAQVKGEGGEWVECRVRGKVDANGTSYLERIGRHNARGGWKKVNPVDVVVLLDAEKASGDGKRRTALMGSGETIQVLKGGKWRKCKLQAISGDVWMAVGDGGAVHFTACYMDELDEKWRHVQRLAPSRSAPIAPACRQPKREREPAQITPDRCVPTSTADRAARRIARGIPSDIPSVTDAPLCSAAPPDPGQLATKTLPALIPHRQLDASACRYPLTVWPRLP